MKRAAVILIALAILGVGTALVALYSGIYNIAATQQHTRPFFWALETGMKHSIDRRADDVRAPDRFTTEMAERGLRLYQSHCLQCHGAPGVAPHDFAKGMRPVPSNLVQSARRLSASELFWVIKHGIKMTGMPAWDYRMTDEAIWDIVAFVLRLPDLAPAEYADMAQPIDDGLTGRTPQQPDEAGAEPLSDDNLGDPAQGRRAILQYGCISCHIVPGIVGREVRVGPALGGIGSRKYIAGVVPNTPENMIRWLQDPQAVDPLTAMPDMGVTEEHARDIAVYLYSLEPN